MTVSYVGRGESLSWVYGVDNVNIPNSDVVDSPFMTSLNLIIWIFRLIIILFYREKINR